MRNLPAPVVFATLTTFVFFIGCSRVTASSTPTKPAVANSAIFQTSTCQSTAVIAAHNGETFAVELRATQLVAGGLGPGSWPQKLGTLSPGRTDTLYDLRREATRVEAWPDSAHGQYNSPYRNGPPSVWPRNVQFTCVNAS